MTYNSINNNDHSQSLVVSAIALSQTGWSVVPLKPQSKEPLISWKDLQRRKLTEREIIEIFERHPNANLGVVTGRVSNLLVLDADSPETVKKLGVPETPIVETSRGRHYYFAFPDERIKSVTGIADGLDVKAAGGYVVSPPSVHPSGKQYAWLIPPRGLDPFGAEPAPPPAWLMEMLSRRRAQPKALAISQIVGGVKEGKRNDAAARYAGYLLAKTPEDLWESDVWPTLRHWNKSNKPPLPEKELRQVFESIAQRELQKRSQISQKHNDLLEKFVNFVTANHSQAQIAQNLKVSQSTVSRLLKTLKSLTPGKRISFESNIANGCRFSSRKLCTKGGSMVTMVASPSD